MIIARRLQVGSLFTMPHTALKYGGALVKVVSRSYQARDGESFVAIEFQGVDIPEVGGTVSFTPHTELDDGHKETR